MLEQLDPALFGLANRIKEAERPRTVDGGLTPPIRILAAFGGGSMLLGQMVLATELVLVLLLGYELPHM